jgi:predicted nucleic acid-binding protein
MLSRQKVFLDTSVFSAYFDERQPERRALTREFWQKLENFKVYTSEVTKQELEATTDSTRRKQFRELIEETEILSVSKDAEDLASRYIKEGIIPAKFINDALQISVATVNQIAVVLSWNFRHMVNQKVKTRINAINVSLNYPVTEIAAPAEYI